MGKSLIAIDDEPDILDIIGRVARDLGFDVATTPDPARFKAMIRGGAAPELILLDLQIPGCDGIELLRYLFEQQCTAEIVLISGVDAKVITVATHVGVELGLRMAKPLQKPLRVAELRAFLAHFLAEQPDIDVALLRNALDDGEIFVNYQPLVDLQTSRLVGWEALARWRQPTLGLVPPSCFIPLAEKEGLMPVLTDQVLAHALAEMSTWGNGPARLSESFVSVNFSAIDLADRTFPDRLERLCRQHAVRPDRLRLELTETAAMAENVRFTEVLTRLRVKGYRLAIDDFGTGYSSLVQLYRLPFSELKIDQTFVHAMASSEEAASIVSAIIGLGHSLHLDLVAEGVESGAVVDLLVKQGCEIGQGYHFARPMSAQAIRRWCEENSQFLAA